MTSTTTAYQFDAAGLFMFPTVSHESPLEPGVFLLPAGCTFVAPQPEDEVPEGKWPRWNGAAWVLVNKPPAQPQATVPDDPIAKLAAFLADNPDVAAIINNQGQPSNV